MFLTYLTCIQSGRCPKLPHLPTISNTWDSPPGNYISRFVVSVVSLLFASIQFPLWLPSGPVKSYRTHRAVGVTATFCLSWVGAICDASWPQCRGNNGIHSAFAITFFILVTRHSQRRTGRHPVLPS